jgi:hypothetical protein
VIEQERHDGDGNRHCGNHQQHTEQQHLAEWHTEQAGQRKRADTGNGQDDSAFEADGHGGRHSRGSVLADLRGQAAAQRCRDDKQHIEKDRLQQGRDRQRHRIGHALWPK